MGLSIGGLGESSSNSDDLKSDNGGFSDINDNAAVTNVQGFKLAKNSTANINITDGGAVKSAFGFADKQSSQAFEFANTQSSQAYDYSRDISKSAAGTVSAAVTAVSESARSETENIFINLQKYLLYGAMIWGAVQVFKANR